MAVVLKSGDMFTSDAWAIGHGVNTVGVMGAGIAVQFRNRFPKMYEEYVSECKKGTPSPGMVMFYEENDHLVCNLFTQTFPGSNATLTALRLSLDDTLSNLFRRGVDTLAIPRIGSGIGGLDWSDAFDMISRVAEDYPDVTVEVWSLPEAHVVPSS